MKWTMDPVLVVHNSSSLIGAAERPEHSAGSLSDPEETTISSPKKPDNPRIQARSTSTGSGVTCATALSHSSSRMDWTITSHNENADGLTSDGDAVAEALGKMTLVQEEALPSHNTEPTIRHQSVEFQMEPIVHEFKSSMEEHCHRPVPTSVQIHRALPPGSLSSRMRRSTGGTVRRSVSFHQVQIRRYPMIAGDNPACQMGTPVTMDWGFEELPLLDLDAFEATRSQTRRRKLHHLILNYFQRNRILLGMGYTEEEIKETEKQVQKERFKRDLTKLTLPVAKLEEAVQSVRRKWRRKVNKAEKEEKSQFDALIRRLREEDSKRLLDLMNNNSSDRSRTASEGVA